MGSALLVGRKQITPMGCTVYPNQVGDIDVVVNNLPDERVVLVAHDASGPPAIDWALRNPERVEELVLLNTYYEWTIGLRRATCHRAVLDSRAQRDRPIARRPSPVARRPSAVGDATRPRAAPLPLPGGLIHPRR
ncbi:alpha/beta fold hydrolase [Rhodococcus oxybenzonivorans]|nr:alpha/beta hydrolase [Rhodococcus oxybenzonivorans]